MKEVEVSKTIIEEYSASLVDHLTNDVIIVGSGPAGIFTALELLLINPDKKILMSPATKYFPGKMPEMIDSWLAILDEVPLDIMAPQDSIGTCGNELVHQAETYKAWAEICNKKNITFWSNIEIFERKDSIDGENHSIPASPERVMAQINNAASCAEKLICSEAPYYMFDTTAESEKLKNFLKPQVPKLMHCH
jgi:hypothetical protein